MRRNVVKTLVGFVLITSIATGAQAQDGSRLRTTMLFGMELSYEVVDGLAVHAGDIVLGTAEQAAAHAPAGELVLSPEGPPVSRLAPYPTGVLWPSGIVPYVIDDDVPMRESIIGAIGIWNAKTVVRFVQRSEQPDYLRFAVREAG